MWISGVMQGMMWRAVNPDGTLMYTHIQSIAASWPLYVIRLLGGILYLSGMVLMAYNVFKTVVVGQAVNNAPIPVPVDAHH
jgi:cytochrome c oxidase cbb3-type subunit 1